MSLNIGDRVIVRYWDDMAQHYDECVDFFGNVYLDIPQGFTQDMRDCSGKEYNIFYTNVNSGGRYYFLEGHCRSPYAKYFSEEMLIRVENDEEFEADTSLIDDFLGGVSCEI